MSIDEDAVRVTAENVQALTHPLRVQILGLLRVHGPATASGLAARLGLTSGALSYHLRQLERFGFIVEDPERGNRRDRWWRAAHRSTEFERADLDLLSVDAGDALERGLVDAIARSLHQAQAERSGWAPEWQRAFEMSDVLLQVTAAEAERLSAELMALLRRYRAHEPGVSGPAGSRAVSARFQVYPIDDLPIEEQPIDDLPIEEQPSDQEPEPRR